MFRSAFSALTLLAGRQEEHTACKNWVMRWKNGTGLERRKVHFWKLYQVKDSHRPTFQKELRLSKLCLLLLTIGSLSGVVASASGFGPNKPVSGSNIIDRRLGSNCFSSICLGSYGLVCTLPLGMPVAATSSSSSGSMDIISSLNYNQHFSQQSINYTSTSHEHQILYRVKYFSKQHKEQNHKVTYDVFYYTTGMRHPAKYQ